MRTTDLYTLTGKTKQALQSWANKQIDVLLTGDKAAASTFAKNAVNNLLHRYDEAINRAIDSAFIFVADESGAVDTDVLIDRLADLFNEMEIVEADVVGFHIKAGKGRAEVLLPRNPILQIIAGNVEGFALTAEDIRNFKSLFNA